VRLFHLLQLTGGGNVSNRRKALISIICDIDCIGDISNTNNQLAIAGSLPLYRIFFCTTPFAALRFLVASSLLTVSNASLLDTLIQVSLTNISAIP
jgi:hypothetical protein